MKKYFWLILFVITIAGLSLRLVNLDTNPPHLGNDEISIAFDSYSVRIIGKDEHGHWWPVSFQSHQTYKSPLYAYLNMPFNYVLGNTEYGVRTLSAVAGSLNILFVGIIGLIISGPVVGIAGALLMAIDPKNIFASRIAYESNLAVTMMLMGMVGVINYIKFRKNEWLIFSGIFWGLSIWSYHTEWGLIPMMLMVIPFIFRNIFKIGNWSILVLTTIIVALPIYYNFVAVQRADPNNRASSQLWFSDGQFKDYLKNSQDNFIKKSVKTVVTPVYYYLEHFGLNVNFSSGADLFNKRSPLMSGWFLLATLPLLIFGLIQIQTIFGQWWVLLLTWWLLCPIVPAMTGSVSAVRNLPFIAPTCLIMAGGFKYLWAKSRTWSWLIVMGIVINFLMFGIAYYIHYPKDSGNNFQYGYKQAWEYIKPSVDNFDKVVVEDRFGLNGQYTGVPHLYFGYFGAYSPEDMQKRNDDKGLKISKYIFKYVDWNQEVYQPKTIYIVSAINPKAGLFRDKLKEVTRIKNTDSEDQFIIYQTLE